MPNFGEWRTENSQRRYPLADDTTGAIPNDVFLDAVIHPIGVIDLFYISYINTSTGEVEVTDVAGTVYPGTRSGSQVVLSDDLGRVAGRLVLGPGFDSAPSPATYTMEEAQLAVSCIMSVTPGGVQALRLPSGELMTGDVIFEGRNGINISVRYEDGKPVITFDAVGVTDDLNCVDLGSAVKCIRINQLNLGAMLIEQAGSQITIGHRVPKEDICTANATLPDSDGEVPDAPDPCTEPPEGVIPFPPYPPFVPPPDPCPAINGSVQLGSGSSALNIMPGEQPNTIIIQLRGR
jgi:hypothetical protein